MGLGYGEGAELQAPLARVVIFGLSASTIITLVFVPLHVYAVRGRAGRAPQGRGGHARAGRRHGWEVAVAGSTRRAGGASLGAAPLARVDELTYALLRVVAGSLFAFHGMQKIFGMYGGTVQHFPSQLWWGGMIELVCGPLIAVGLPDGLARVPRQRHDGGRVLPGPPARGVLAHPESRRARRPLRVPVPLPVSPRVRTLLGGRVPAIEPTAGRRGERSSPAWGRGRGQMNSKCRLQI